MKTCLPGNTPCFSRNRVFYFYLENDVNRQCCICHGHAIQADRSVSTSLIWFFIHLVWIATFERLTGETFADIGARVSDFERNFRVVSIPIDHTFATFGAFKSSQTNFIDFKNKAKWRIDWKPSQARVGWLAGSSNYFRILSATNRLSFLFLSEAIRDVLAANVGGFGKEFRSYSA